jgi:hypothetical protein
MGLSRILVISGLVLLVSIGSMWTGLPAQATMIYYNLRSLVLHTQGQPYKTYLLSKDPLVIYIENFISLQEAANLVNLA